MASRRPVVSYDDITLPYNPPERHQPPQKKRKRIASNAPKKVPQHWDDPTATTAAATDEDMDDEESRELTHEEIWDDSALIHAWDAAMEEYEAMNGPDKGWKKEPAHKSPLWYNVPPKNAPKKLTAGPETNGGELDSQPIDFDTFVPTHDPTLASGATDKEDAQQAAYAIPLTHVSNVSQDEAFERAVQASYWSGYWTAVYHCHQRNQKSDFDAEQEENEEEEEGEESEEFVSTQR